MGQTELIYHPDYYCDIGEHVFPTEKYGLLYRKLLENGIICPENILEPAPATREQLQLVHTPGYINDLFESRQTPGTLTSEMPISPHVIRAFTLQAGGTILACQTAASHQTATLNLGGGFHHAYPDHAEGFCYINDVAAGVRAIQEHKLVERPLICDCDLHQGNGTAAIFRNDPRVYTLSIHQQNIYPPKENSDRDAQLPDLCTGDRYLRKLNYALTTALERHNPDFILYVAGADPYREDILGSLALTMDDLKKRDDMVTATCHDNDIPQATVLAGGYAPNVQDVVHIHYQTVCSLIDHWSSQ